ncbi:unnamed protein product [Ascophyllum nodosum]
MDIMVNKILVEVKAFESRGGSQGAESGEFTYLAAVETAAQFKCPTCGNRDQSNFTLDSKQGDTICLGADGHGCGTVVQDHKVHEGNMYRKFEGEADRSHHGPAPNRLYSTAHNMRTWISEGKDAGKLRNLAEDVEMGLSTIGKDERKTRTAYKDQMKREAFDLINHIAGNCDLHEVVTVRAKELFAGWRNVKEHVHNKHAVICACIIGAYREIGTEELSRLFQRRQLLGIKGTNGDQEVCETDGRVELARVGGFTQEPRDSRAGSLHPSRLKGRSWVEDPPRRTVNGRCLMRGNGSRAWWKPLSCRRNTRSPSAKL